MSKPLTVTTPNDRDVVVVRTFDAPASLVFDAHSKPELVKRWLLGPPGWTMPICEIDFRVGGAWRYGWAHATQKGFEMSGVFREIVPNRKIVHTEVYQGSESLDTAVFVEKNGRTTMTMTMTYPSKEIRDAALATGMTGGMESSYQNLDAMLEKSSAA